MTKKPDIEDLMGKLERGEITLDDIPPEAVQYALSSQPDLDSEFFEVLQKSIKPGGERHCCPFCGADSWKVIPFFGALMSLRSYGTQGIHSNKEVYALIECGACKYTMMFNVRDSLENFVKEADRLDVQMQGMRGQHSPKSPHAEEDPPPGDAGPENRKGPQEH